MKQLPLPLRILLIINLLVVLGQVLAFIAAYISPAVFWPLAFFGLTYPVFLLLNFLFAIFWLIRKKRIFLFSFLAFLLGLGNIHKLVQINFPSEPLPGQETFKLMSYNVRLFDLYNWSENRQTRNKIFDLIDREAADVICFQEFYQTDSIEYFNTLDTLLEFQDAKYVHTAYTKTLLNKNRFGIATFSRFPILDTGRVNFKNGRNNICIYSDLLIDGDTFRVYNAHLASVHLKHRDYDFLDSPGKDEDNSLLSRGIGIFSRVKKASIKRSHQADALAAHVGQSPHPVILAGDFNDPPTSYTYRTIARGLEDAFIQAGNGFGNTYNRFFPSFRIDFILHTPDLETLEFNTIRAKLSDHYPITAQIALPLND